MWRNSWESLKTTLCTWQNVLSPGGLKFHRKTCLRETIESSSRREEKPKENLKIWAIQIKMTWNDTTHSLAVSTSRLRRLYPSSLLIVWLASVIALSSNFKTHDPKPFWSGELWIPFSLWTGLFPFSPDIFQVKIFISVIVIPTYNEKLKLFNLRSPYYRQHLMNYFSDSNLLKVNPD